MVIAPKIPPKKGMNLINKMIPNTKIMMISEYFQYCSFMLLISVSVYFNEYRLINDKRKKKVIRMY